MKLQLLIGSLKAEDFSGFTPLLKNFLNSSIFKGFYDKTDIDRKYKDFFVERAEVLDALGNLYLHSVKFALENQHLLGKKTEENNYNIDFNFTTYFKYIESETIYKELLKIYATHNNAGLQCFEGFLKKVVATSVAQAIAYLILTKTINNPLSASIAEADIETSIKKIQNHNHNATEFISSLKEKFDQDSIIISRSHLRGIYHLARSFTNEERFNTAVRHSISEKPVFPNQIFTTTAYAMKAYDVVKTALKNSNKITCVELNRAMVFNGHMAANFSPSALYDVLQYINYEEKHTKKFDPHKKFEVYYDPCGGWGERMASSYFSAYFIRLYVNDKNKNLQVPYLRLGEKLKQYPVKKTGINEKYQNKKIEIGLSFECALDAKLPEKVDFCFTGLPFFNSEQYNHSNISNYRNSADWLQKWALPLFDKLFDNTNPGGYIVANLGKDKAGKNLASSLTKLIKTNADVARKITHNSLYNKKTIFYNSNKKWSSYFLIFQKESNSMLYKSPHFDQFELEEQHDGSIQDFFNNKSELGEPNNMPDMQLECYTNNLCSQNKQINPIQGSPNLFPVHSTKEISSSKLSHKVNFFKSPIKLKDNLSLKDQKLLNKNEVNLKVDELKQLLLKTQSPEINISSTLKQSIKKLIDKDDFFPNNEEKQHELDKNYPLRWKKLLQTIRFVSIETEIILKFKRYDRTENDFIKFLDAIRIENFLVSAKEWLTISKHINYMDRFIENRKVKEHQGILKELLIQIQQITKEDCSEIIDKMKKYISINYLLNSGAKKLRDLNEEIKTLISEARKELLKTQLGEQQEEEIEQPPVCKLVTKRNLF